MTKKLDLDELEKLEKAATQRPWSHHGRHTTGKLWLYGTADDNHPRIALIEEGLNYGQDVSATERANADLITTMRNALPALIAAARRAQELWDERRQILQDAGNDQFDLIKRAEAAEARIKVLEAEVARKDEALRNLSAASKAVCDKWEGKHSAGEVTGLVLLGNLFAATRKARATLSPAPQNTAPAAEPWTKAESDAAVNSAAQDKPETVCPDCEGEGYIREADVFNARDWACIRCNGTGRENTQ